MECDLPKWWRADCCTQKTFIQDFQRCLKLLFQHCFKIFSRYDKHSAVCSSFKSSTTLYIVSPFCVTILCHYIVSPFCVTILCRHLVSPFCHGIFLVEYNNYDKVLLHINIKTMSEFSLL